MTTAEELRDWIGRTLVDDQSEKVGRIEDIYADDETGKPEWLAVTTGWFAHRISFVPLAGATRQGDNLAVSFPRELIKDAPHAEPDGELSQDEEQRLYQHYGVAYGESRSDSGLPESRPT